jgi:hypothetical protein
MALAILVRENRGKRLADADDVPTGRSIEDFGAFRV